MPKITPRNAIPPYCRKCTSGNPSLCCSPNCPLYPLSVKLTPLKAIRKKCLDCTSTSNEVKNCAFSDCPLHILRFGRRIPRGTSRLKSIRKYCIWCMNNRISEISKCTAPNCALFIFRSGKRPKANEIGS